MLDGQPFAWVAVFEVHVQPHEAGAAASSSLEGWAPLQPPAAMVVHTQSPSGYRHCIPARPATQKTPFGNDAGQPGPAIAPSLRAVPGPASTACVAPARAAVARGRGEPHAGASCISAQAAASRRITGSRSPAGSEPIAIVDQSVDESAVEDALRGSISPGRYAGVGGARG